MSETTGFFCVFEGVDGSGKSTLIEPIARALRAHPLVRARFTDVLTLREPTDSPEGLAIRRRLKESSDASPGAWLEYFQTDRAGNVERNIRPGLAAGRLLLQDRYFYSTAAYQGSDDASKGSPEAIVRDSFARGFPRPDLLVYLNITPEDALGRIDRGRARRETFETLDRLRQVAARYERILPPETLRLDARDTPEALTEQTVRTILERI